jgi:hypothetical protein
MTANNLSLSGSHLMKCQTALFGNKRIRLAGYSPLAVVNHHHPEGSVFSFFPILTSQPILFFGAPLKSSSSSFIFDVKFSKFYMGILKEILSPHINPILRPSPTSVLYTSDILMNPPYTPPLYGSNLPKTVINLQTPRELKTHPSTALFTQLTLYTVNDYKSRTSSEAWIAVGGFRRRTRESPTIVVFFFLVKVACLIACRYRLSRLIKCLQSLSVPGSAIY